MLEGACGGGGGDIRSEGRGMMNDDACSARTRIEVVVHVALGVLWAASLTAAYSLGRRRCS